MNAESRRNAESVPGGSVKAFPHLPRAWWECHCGREKPRRETSTIPVRTIVSLMRPACPFCGRMFREEFRVEPGAERKPKPRPVTKKRASTPPPGQMSLFEESE
jgi:hypothetical protein